MINILIMRDLSIRILSIVLWGHNGIVSIRRKGYRDTGLSGAFDPSRLSD